MCSGAVTLQVFDIARFALHDGPGIRTTVFLQGCRMHCPWCANPESWQSSPQLMQLPGKCVGCGACAGCCPAGAIALSGARPVIDRILCTGCGICAAGCPAQALHIAGKAMTVDEIVDIVCRDADYYRHSGGGVTLSGGEPLLQADGALALLAACRRAGLHTAIETTGYAAPALFAQTVPFVDLYLYDYKHGDNDALLAVTGGDGGIIAQNLMWLANTAPHKLCLRIPVIPGFNADAHTMEAMYRTLYSYGIRTVTLLPYHTLGEHKYEQLGKTACYDAGVRMLGTEDLLPLQALGAAMGLDILIG